MMSVSAKKIYSCCMLLLLSVYLVPGVQASTPDEQKKVILVMGDSLSAAYNLAAEQGWVSLLQTRINEEALPYRVVNASVSGATTSAGLQALPRALAEHQPSWVLIELGGNDGLQGKPLKFVRRQLETLIQASLAAKAKVLLLGIRMPPNYGRAYTEPFFNQYAELAEHYQLAYVPFLLEGIADKPELMMGDGIHPKAEAQILVLNNVWPVLRPLLDK